MINYYERKHLLNGKVISLETLKSLILDHPRKQEVLRLHHSDYGSAVYSQIKNQMPVVTPQCTFKDGGRKTKDNIDSFSGYYYFDIDAKNIERDIEDYKTEMIAQYGDYICLLGKSIGGRGLFFYVELQDRSVISSSNFTNIRQHIIDKYFSKLPIDKQCTNENRLQFIPYDPDLFESDCKIIIDTDVINSFTYTQYNNKRKEERYISRMGEKYTPINVLLSRYQFETPVEVESPVYDIKRVESYIKIHIPTVIPDGRKHGAFSTIANRLIHLNPGITLFDVTSYLNYINQNHTGGKKMRQPELISLAANVFNRTLIDGLWLGKRRCKNVHFNKKAILGRMDKILIANRENGIIRKNRSKQLIISAIRMLKSCGEPVSQARVAQVLKGRLSRGPVEKYWKECLSLSNELQPVQQIV